MAITKAQREELRSIKAHQSRKFFKTGVSIKGGLKGTDNRGRETGVKRETTTKHVTACGKVVELNANHKAKIAPKLGKAVPKVIEKEKIKTLSVTLTLVKSGVGVEKVVNATANVVTTVTAAHDDLVEELASALGKEHNRPLEAFADAADNRKGTFVPVTMERGIYTYKFDYKVS